ncbi:NAD(P)H-dependent oxidoreductase [Leucobacter luti]|uniref:Putative NADPH-quinone reductase n=1 Tax=Leucobacter luti TaxID=340320 RepID=A0A4Q7U1M6_9MICO|nr:NAD(P)H-dependent oxidoreductase [Leucobacter luti]MBL3699611.1 flavodoxin family protein [Leucobacter luti]RZT67123.1 putative NADPH-quinone reductase [Leucobacter luti]
MPTALVIDGHPNPDSLSAALARSYAEAHGDARVLALRDLDFDPHMRFGYRQRIPIEPELQDARDALHSARRIVIVAPMWWGGVPALLKGFFDRALLPGQEYRMSTAGLPVGLLRGRNGRFFMLADTPALGLPFTGNAAAGQVARHTMRFVGVRPFRVHRFLGVGAASPARRERWIERAARLGAGDGQHDARRARRGGPSAHPERSHTPDLSAVA